MNNKQSSVDWLYNELFPKQLDGFSESEWKIIDKAFKQAKELHKDEIKKTYQKGYEDKDFSYFDSEQYYNETFNK